MIKHLILIPIPILLLISISILFRADFDSISDFVIDSDFDYLPDPSSDCPPETFF